MKIILINGPNINFTGIREKDTYGNMTFEDINNEIEEYAGILGFELDFFQSNHEGEIIDKIQSLHKSDIFGIIVNLGAFTHYSYAIKDALSSIKVKTIEVHMSNIYSREEFRHKSVISDIVEGQIVGFSHRSYLLALDAFKHIVNQP